MQCGHMDMLKRCMIVSRGKGPDMMLQLILCINKCVNLLDSMGYQRDVFPAFVGRPCISWMSGEMKEKLSWVEAC